MPPVTCVESLHGVFHGHGAKGARGLSMGRVIPCGPGLRSLETRTQSSASLGGWVLRDPALVPAVSQIES